MATSAMIPPILIIFSLLNAPMLCNAADADPSFVEFIKETILSHQIVMFSKTYCPYCLRAKKVFEELNTEPYVIELNKIEFGRELQDAMAEVAGRRSVPQVFVNGKHVGGSTETVSAYNSGRLAKLIRGDSSGIADL